MNAGGNKTIAPLMAAIAMAESGGNSNAKNPSGATGLWQILGAVNASDQSKLTNPQVNAHEAVLKYNSQGLKAWEAYTNGAYKQFYKGNTAASALPQGGSTAAASGGGGGNGILGIPTEITNFFTQANTFVTALMWLASPGSWVRIGAFIVGVALLLFAIHALIAVGEGGEIMPKAPAIVPIPV
jgi:hypothetical protein